MAFETGSAANEFELQEKLNSFVLSISGWSKVSQSGDFDSVYFSQGEDGYKDIYIRSAGGQVEPPYSGSQRDLGDGYTGYLNFFTYQFFPEGGDGYDGYGEAGKFGPMLIYGVGRFTNALYYQAFSQQGSGSSDARRWTRLRNINVDVDGVSVGTDVSLIMDPAWDGRDNLYYTTGNVASFSKYNFGGEFASVLQFNPDISSGDAIVYYEDRVTRKRYIYMLVGGAPTTIRASTAEEQISPDFSGLQMRRWDLDDGVWEFGIEGIEWPSVSGSFDSSPGPFIWDGMDNLYLIRARSTTTDWARYNIPTDSWIIFTSESPPTNAPHADYRSPALPAVAVTNQTLVWLDKNISGFSNHRLYTSITAGAASAVYYVDIDGDTKLPVGSWTSAGLTPTPLVDDGNFLLHNNRNRWYFYKGSTFTDLEVYSADMTDGTLSWSSIDADYLPTPAPGTNRTSAIYSDGYASRVRTSLYDSTTYWFFGSKDHITVVTKSDDKYSFCYMGAISPHASTSPAAKTVTDILPGTNEEIQITDIRGEFIIGQRMYISDVVDGGGGTETGDVENIPRNFMPTEFFTITDVSPGVSITVDQINNRYSAGSRIGLDPQPVGITMDGFDKIQMLNSINTFDSSGGFSMALNIAKLETVKESVVNASGGDARRNLYALWPINILNSEANDTSLSGEEARGSLIGVFATSGTGTLVTEDTISVGENTYITFDVSTSKNFRYVFGPTN